MGKFVIQTWTKNETLRAISNPVKPADMKKAILLADEMIKYIKNPKNGWVGLAAPQIGVNQRIIVVALMRTPDDEHCKIVGMINPVILEHSEDTCIESEWCLSVPGEFGDVVRYTTIKLNYTDLKGKNMTIILGDFAARIVQHEIDHLDGVLFTDKVIKKEKKGRVE